MSRDERPACEHCARDFKQYGTVRTGGLTLSALTPLGHKGLNWLVCKGLILSTLTPLGYKGLNWLVCKGLTLSTLTTLGHKGLNWLVCKGLKGLGQVCMFGCR